MGVGLASLSRQDSEDRSWVHAAKVFRGQLHDWVSRDVVTAFLLGGFKGVSRSKKAQVVAANTGGALPAWSVS